MKNFNIISYNKAEKLARKHAYFSFKLYEFNVYKTKKEKREDKGFVWAGINKEKLLKDIKKKGYFYKYLQSVTIHVGKREYTNLLAFTTSIGMVVEKKALNEIKSELFKEDVA